MSDTHTHSHMALLVMDVQEGIVTRFAQTGDFLKRINTAITAARTASILVIYVRVAFRQGYPEISPKNKSFSRVLLSKVFPRQAEVVPVEAWNARLKLEAGA